MDAGVLEQVLYHIHNWFERESFTVSGCEVVGGSLPESVTADMLDGQWFRIEGSYLNDGLHQNPADDLEDETFDGTISLLAIPKALTFLVDEITDWIDATSEASQAALRSPYQSESFDGYSYSLKGNSVANLASGGLSGWQAEFAGRLNPWRKMH